MSLKLSVLDQSPISAGRTARDAFEETVGLAQLAERCGYTRYWLAEHHNTTALAGSAPEVLIARVAGATERMRVGSGGVMLQHYSPLKVAETFRVLATLFPGRIDLGIGRAPGSDQRTAVALAQGHPTPIERFPDQLRDLASFLHDEVPADHPFRGVRALPQPAPASDDGDQRDGETSAAHDAPEIWLLGSSGQSAAYAARFGFAFSYAHFINPHGSLAVLHEYRDGFQPSRFMPEPRASLAVRVICAETDEEAQRLSSSFALARLHFHRGQLRPLPTVEEALAYPYTEVERAQIEQIMAGVFVGSPRTLEPRLAQVASAHGVDEMVVITLIHGAPARQRSYELLAQAFGLTTKRQA